MQARGQELEQAAHGDEWGLEDYTLSPRLPEDLQPPPGKVFLVEQSAPIVTLNAIANDNHAVNAGWAINSFSGPTGTKVAYQGGMTFTAQVALRDRDGWLGRVGYALTAILSVTDPDPFD